MTNLKAVQETAEKFNNDVLEIAKELKRVQSIKCRLKKMTGRKDYDEKMTETLKYEQVLKQARQLLDPKEKPVTMYEQADVDMLDYDETVKALRSIQSKKTLSKYLTEVPGDNDEYRNACRIEAMLIERRNNTKPVDNEYIRKTDLLTMIDTIKETADISKETIIELLESLM